jgi:CheY-like chemotaxis protein
MSHTKAVVLVVEDNLVIRMGTVEFLTDSGFETLEANNADAAIQVLEARLDIHLVFTDVEMPGSMDGIKLSHYIRNRWPPVYLIVASGKPMLRECHLPIGARFFPKPYSYSVIVETMTGMMASLGFGQKTFSWARSANRKRERAKDHCQRPRERLRRRRLHLCRRWIVSDFHCARTHLFSRRCDCRAFREARLDGGKSSAHIRDRPSCGG